MPAEHSRKDVAHGSPGRGAAHAVCPNIHACFLRPFDIAYVWLHLGTPYYD